MIYAANTLFSARGQAFVAAVVPFLNSLEIKDYCPGYQMGSMRMRSTLSEKGDASVYKYIQKTLISLRNSPWSRYLHMLGDLVRKSKYTSPFG